MLGIIGGTGLYDLEELTERRTEDIQTPFGASSASVTIGKYRDHEVAFLPRHGKRHNLLPSEINYRANIFALKTIGVTSLISVSAVGSLKEDLKPGSLALPSQYLDLTKKDRGRTFFGDGLVAHISSAHPVSNLLVKQIIDCGRKLGIDIRDQLTYACIEGPRLGTQAESYMLRTLGADLVGMTNCPEAFLALEAQISYASICVVTDYDSWHEDPAEHATVNMVMERYFQSLGNVVALLGEVITQPLVDNSCPSRTALQYSVVTKEEAMSAQQRELLAVLRK